MPVQNPLLESLGPIFAIAHSLQTEKERSRLPLRNACFRLFIVRATLPLRWRRVLYPVFRILLSPMIARAAMSFSLVDPNKVQRFRS